MKHIVSFSGGKDSTASVHVALERGIQIDLILCFECEWDMPRLKEHCSLVEQKTGIPIVYVRYYRHFNEMLARWGWPKSAGGWCTACKHRTCLKYIRHIKGDKTELVGFATDEEHRTQSKWMLDRKWPVRFPLIEAGMTSADALEYCYDLGYTWGGHYKTFKRWGCFCCPKGGKAKREKVRQNRPELEREWCRLDAIAEASLPDIRTVTTEGNRT